MAVIEHLTLRVSPELKELLKEAAYASRMSINHKANEILAEALEPQTQGAVANGADNGE